VTLEQINYLKDSGYLKQEKGRYPDESITSKNKGSKRKKRYVPDYIYEKYLK
jgi:hypothetical protein